MSLIEEVAYGRRPHPEDRCELCGRAFELGDVVSVHGPHAGVIDNDGNFRKSWQHETCRPAPVEHAVAARPRHHDPVVAELLDRVDALEAKARR